MGRFKMGRLGSGLIRKTQINIVLQNIYIKPMTKKELQ